MSFTLITSSNLTDLNAVAQKIRIKPPILSEQDLADLAQTCSACTSYLALLIQLIQLTRACAAEAIALPDRTERAKLENLALYIDLEAIASLYLYLVRHNLIEDYWIDLEAIAAHTSQKNISTLVQ